MNARQHELIALARRIESYVETKGAELGLNGSFSHFELGMLRQTMAQADSDRVDLHKASRQAGLDLAACRQRVEDQLHSFRAVARRNLPEQGNTGLGDEIDALEKCRSLRLPAGRMQDAELLRLASVVAELARGCRRTLAMSGLPRDFVRSLAQGAKAFERGLRSRDANLRSGSAASARIAQAATRLRATIRLVDVLVRARTRDNPQLLAEWRAVRHPSSGGD